MYWWEKNLKKKNDEIQICPCEKWYKNVKRGTLFYFHVILFQTGGSSEPEGWA